MHDPSVLGAGANGISYLATLWDINEAKDFLSSLLKTQEAGITRNYQQQVEWVGQGKYAAGLWPNPGQAVRYLKAGAPIAIAHLKDGAVASPAFGCLGVAAKPAHPNATAVFVNWFLSREGQSLAVKSYELPSARLDVPAHGGSQRIRDCRRSEDFHRGRRVQRAAGKVDSGMEGHRGVGKMSQQKSAFAAAIDKIVAD